MLLAKLCLVPAFLLLISLASRLWGPVVGGWLAGLPIVAGPILYILALAQGPDFATQASTFALAAIAASEAFNFAYAWSCRRLAWPISIMLGLTAWLLVATGLQNLHPSVAMAAFAGAIAVAISWLWLPQADMSDRQFRRLKNDLVLRIIAGAGLTLAVTSAAQVLGPTWSGLLAVFPLLGVILCASSHRNNGSAFTINLIRGMILGRLSFAAFCLSLIVGLPEYSLNQSFSVAVIISLATQAAVMPLINRMGRDTEQPATRKMER